ncbi:MAG TPA: ComF family protein [Candidatus Paceibacterota bacterium]
MARYHKSVANIFARIADCIIPRRCAGCKKPHETLCVLCAQQSFEPWIRCFVCGARRTTGSFCPGSCRAKTPKALKKIYWAGPYDKALREAIGQLKYKKRKELAERLGKLLAQKFYAVFCNVRSRTSNTSKPDFEYVVVPIPLHPNKERSRGFNQALLIARVFAKEIGAPMIADVLIKTIDTEPQARIASREERLKNLTGAFAVSKSDFNSTYGSRTSIILVDDVATTGATLFEASRTLEKAGISTIIGFVVAHG